MLRFKVFIRIEKSDLNYCEDVIPNLINLTDKTIDMINLRKPGILKEVKKLYDGLLEYENDSDAENDSIEYDEGYELSEDSVTGEKLGFRNL